MNPIPVSWCAGGALILAALSFGAGWKANDWRRDSQQLEAVKKGVEHTAKQADTIHTEATRYNERKADADQNARARETEVRTIYKDRAVPGACEPDPSAVSVLDRAIADANASARGEPGATVPEPSR